MITRKRAVTILVALIFYFSAINAFAAELPGLRQDGNAGFLASLIKAPILLFKDVLVVEHRVHTDGLISLVNLGIGVLTGSLQLLRRLSDIAI